MPLGRGLGALIPQRRNTKVYSTSDPAQQIQPRATKEGALLQVPTSLIHANPHQPRKEFSHSALEELIASIKTHGILQPLLVTEQSDGTYELISGERRWRSAMMLELPTVPVIVRHAEDHEKLELALIENIQRTDLNPIEEGYAYQRLATEFGYSQETIAERVGKSRSAISNTIRLLTLPDDIQKALIDGKITMGKARALLGVPDASTQHRLFVSMMGSEMNTREVERVVRSRGKGSTRRDPNLGVLEDTLRTALGTKVVITERGEKGTIAISYYSKEELRRVVDQITL